MKTKMIYMLVLIIIIQLLCGYNYIGKTVSLPTFKITVNSQEIDQVKSKYPLIMYNNITYFPMTWNYSKALGLDVNWSREKGLRVASGNKGVALSEDNSGNNDMNAQYEARLVPFTISVNEEIIDNDQEEYPLLLFRDVTYFPLTWRFAVEAFGWDYKWDAMEGLSIDLGAEQSNEEISIEEQVFVESYTYEDFLTPKYYTDSDFRNEVNQFRHYLEKVTLLNPLNDDLSDYYISANGSFGAGKGPSNTEGHHPALDMYLNGKTEVNIYASHDGFISVDNDAEKYRHYVSVTKGIVDDEGKTVGKLVTYYAHIDLDKDNSLVKEGEYVERGQLISKNLYAQTMGGPHLHYEIRYYRSEDEGNEEYYGARMPDNAKQFTELSVEPWQYGYWDPTVGYGYGNPENFGIK